MCYFIVYSIPANNYMIEEVMPDKHVASKQACRCIYIFTHVYICMLTRQLVPAIVMLGE